MKALRERHGTHGSQERPPFERENVVRKKHPGARARFYHLTLDHRAVEEGVIKAPVGQHDSRHGVTVLNLAVHEQHRRYKGRRGTLVGRQSRQKHHVRITVRAEAHQVRHTGRRGNRHGAGDRVAPRINVTLHNANPVGFEARHHGGLERVAAGIEADAIAKTDGAQIGIS